MPARVNRERFLQTLESINPGLSPRDIVEQSSCIIFKDGYVCSFNDEVACRAPSGMDKKFQGAVVAEPLLNLLRKLPEDEIEVDQTQEELTVKGKRRSSGIRLQYEITLPVDSVEKPKEEQWHELHKDFSEAVGVVQACAGKDESQFSMTCIHVHPKWVEACDNFQLCRWRLKTGIEAPTLIRQQALKSITSLGMAEFAETENWIHFRNANKLVLSCRRYTEEFPDLGGILNVTGVKTALPKGLIEAADRATIFSTENAESNLVHISLRGDHLTIKGQGVSGWYKESKTVKYSGEPLEFMIAPALLIEMVKQHPECEVAPDRLKVDGGRFVYVTCLAAMETATLADAEESKDDKPRKKKAKVSANGDGEE